MSSQSIPPNQLYQEYLEKQDIDNISPISFFQFHKFSYKQKDFAGQEYRRLIALTMQQDTSKGDVLLSRFRSQKQNIAQYWNDTKEREKQISHASAVKDEGRAQSLASVQAVTRDTLEIFNTTDSCSSVSTAPSFTTSAVSSTPYDVTNSDMNKEKQQQSSKRTRDNENSVETPIMKHVCKESRRVSFGSHVSSSDSADLSFSENGESVVSTSVLYSWDFLDGPGRLESNVSELWMCDGVDVGGELMACRDRIVENNGGLTGSYEKLAINFIFLIEAEYQVGGLQGEVEDQTWDIICKALKDPIQSLSGEALFEAHQWTHRLANSTYEELEQLLADSAPQNSVLKTILMKMVDGRQLWTTKGRNEDTYLKCQLGPFLDIYLGNLKHTMSVWTPIQNETRDSKSNLMVPDFSVTTQIGSQEVSVLLLEGKLAKNRGYNQIWDDLSKLGQEMKLALDAILKLQPKSDVCVIGIHIHEPVADFYTLKIHAEATYVMRKFATSYIPTEAMNTFPLVHLMEIFEHVRVKVQQTVEQLRQVKIHASPDPKVPLSWLRPSFNKPKLQRILDGQ